MGAWGVGMRANDTALDALAGVSNKKTALAALRHELKQKEDCWNSRAHSVLGIAEYMIEEGHEIPPRLLASVKKVVKGELEDKRVDAWVHCKDRREALERFSKRLNGEAVDEADIAIDNLGLFGRLATNGMSREELKEKWTGK